METVQKYLCYEEIHSQYVQLRETMSYLKQQRNAIKAFFEEKGDVVFVACGSSYWLSLSAKSTMKLKTGRNSYAIKAGDVLLGEKEYEGRFTNPTFICPSRSGSTSEVLEAIKLLKKYYPNAKLLSLVEYQDSPLEKISDLCLSLSWANEKSVCQTRSFSCLYLSSVLIAECISGENVLFEEAARYLEKAPEYYEREIPVLRELVEKNDIQKLICLGSGVQYGVCIEGAYIVIEVAEFASNYFQLFEFRHGPIVLTDKNTAIFLVSSKKSKEYEEKIVGEIRQYTDMVYGVSTGPMPGTTHTFQLEEDYSDEIAALHFVFCLQSISCRIAVKHGRNPDSPGDLVPFIQL